MTGATVRETPEVFRASTSVRIGAIVGMAVVAASYGCGSSSTTLLQPSNDRCAISMPASPPAVASSGGTGSLNISAARECVWSATSDAPWLTITSDTSGQGNGTINFAVASNPAPSMRRGSVAVNSQRTEILQSAAPCQFRLNPAGQSFDVDGGEGTVGVETMDGCSWTAASGAPWIAIIAAQNTNGSGTVRFRVDANPSNDARTSSITIAGQAFTVSQGGAQAPQCNFRIDPAAFNAPVDGGASSVAVSAMPGCAWTATSQAAWLTIASGGSGSGNGTVNLRIAANTGAQRVGTVTIANAIYTVTQAAPLVCTYTLAPPSFSAPASSTNTTITVTAPNGCAWTAASQSGWITVTNGASGNGNGTVSLSIGANSGSARSGTVSIGGQIFSVSQAAVSCTFAISPSSLSPPASGATASVTVTAPSSCAWTATTQAQWIAITGGASGTGNGTVNLTIAANTGGARTGTVTIAGQTYTVTQAAAAPPPCAYSIAPTDQAAPSAGGNFAVAVTAGAGCAWTTSTQAQWISITGGASGNGNGTVNLTVAANTGAARSATVTIAGQTYTINQAAAAPPPCTYSIAPTQLSVPAAGGNSAVNVSASAPDCAWTATTPDQWISIVSGASGQGNGPVNLTFAANTGAARTGIVTIAGQTFTVMQAAAPPPCTYAIAPGEQSVPALGGPVVVSVTAPAGCAWTATTDATWTTIDRGATGSGNGTVEITVARNTGAARTANFVVANQPFRVIQAADTPPPCTYAFDPTSQAATSAGGDFAVAVNTQVGCAWSITSTVPWITFIDFPTGPATGSGNASVRYRVAPNTASSTRVGTLEGSGQVLTVTQAWPF